MTQPKKRKLWSGVVNLDRLEADTGRWRITTGAAKEPLPREVANDVAVRASIEAWMSAHRAGSKSTPDESSALRDGIRASVTSAFRAMQAATPAD